MFKIDQFTVSKKGQKLKGES